MAHTKLIHECSPNEAEYLFFLGIGDAYSGLINLLNTNGTFDH